jgi:hypothetical protein
MRFLFFCCSLECIYDFYVSFVCCVCHRGFINILFCHWIDHWMFVLVLAGRWLLPYHTVSHIHIELIRSSSESGIVVGNLLGFFMTLSSDIMLNIYFGFNPVNIRKLTFLLLPLWYLNAYNIFRCVCLRPGALVQQHVSNGSWWTVLTSVNTRRFISHCRHYWLHNKIGFSPKDYKTVVENKYKNLLCTFFFFFVISALHVLIHF